MTAAAHWQRAMMLCQQQRWQLATGELRALLALEPEHAAGHAMLGMALAQQGEMTQARQHAERAVAVDPESAFAHYALAVVRMESRQFEPAARAIQDAIRLAPEDPDHRSVLAQIRLHQQRHADALAAADGGLAIDPNDIDCLNLRALALTRLGRGAEATDANDASLARNPDNPYSHQTRGFALLQQGDSRGALRHFQEALRRDPTLDGARQGLVEALKARNPIYRLLLGWTLWLGRFTPARQLQITIGLFLAARIGAGALEGAGYETAADVVSWSWVGFVMFTACAGPIFNLLLLLHPLGRHALERQSRRDALKLGAVLVGLLAVLAHGWSTGALWSSVSWPFWLALLLPVAGLGNFHSGWARHALHAFVCVIVAVWLWWVVALEQLAARPLEQTWNSAVAGSVVPRSRDELAAHYRQGGTIVLITALSTWFVLLAPKGHPRRRRTGRG